MKGFFNKFERDFPAGVVGNSASARLLLANGRGSSSGFSSGLGRKLSLSFMLVLLVSVTGIKAAGLNGAYTIDPAGSGTTNYTTFALATAALKANGVSGPVIFNVAAGTFATTVTVSAVTGASATNTVTFHGQGRGKSIISSAGTIVSVNSASYISFDQFSIISTSTSGNIIDAGYSNFCTFSNSIMQAPTGGSAYMIYSYYTSHLTISNNYIYGTYYSVYHYGVSNSSAYGYLNFTKNRVIANGYYGIYAYYTFQDVIQNNVFDSTSGTYANLYMNYCNGVTINANQIIGAGSYTSLYDYYNNYYPVAGKPQTSTITNNFVTGGASYCWFEYDVSLSPATNGTVLVAHNTMYSTASNYGLYLYCSGSSAGAVNYTSNILYSVAGSGVIYNYAYSTNVYGVADGNDYYFSTGSMYFYDGSTTYTFGTFALYQAQMKNYGWEQKSTNFKPTFKSLVKPFDFHLSTTVAGPSGVYCGVNTDIDGNGRFKTPSAGANESLFGVKNDNAGVFAMISPKNFCPGTATFSVDVADLGLNPVGSVYLGWSVDGVVQAPVTYTTKIPLYGDAVVTLGSYTFAAGVKHTLKAWSYLPNGNTDTKASDDTLVVTNIAPSLSGTFTINPAGSGTSNFTTFAAATAYLNASGVCGPVLFKVSPGTYNEQVILGNVSGTSATNTITFDGGDSSKTSVTAMGAAAGQAAMTLNGSSYVTVKRMGFYTGNTTSSMTFHITSGASYNNVIGCIIICDTTTTNTNNAFAMSGSSSPTATDGSHHNTIYNNIVKGGYYGFTCYGSGTSSPSIGNQIIHNRITQAYYYGLYAPYQKDYKIQGNTIFVRPNAANSTYGLYASYGDNGVIDGNIISSNYMGIYPYYADYYITGGTTYITNNIVYGQYYTSGGYSIYAYYSANTKIWHNTIYNTLPSSGYGIYCYGQSSNNLDVRNNIIYRANSAIYAVYSSPANYCNNFDYNDFWGVTGGNFVLMGSTYADIPTMNAGLKATANLACNNCTFVDPGFANTATGSENFHMCKTCYGITGTNVGVKTDIDGDTRCTIFPNEGADETTNGKGAPNGKFFLSANIYPNSPSYVYSTYKAGAPVIASWYLINSTYGTYTHIKDSVALLTSAFTLGQNTLKLVVQSCGGKDSSIQVFNVAAPKAVPGTDFVANKNSILVNDYVNFHDLTTNGPTTWTWKITPDSTIVSGTKVPAIKYTYPSGAAAGTKYQNPQVQFLYPGKYQVCLTTTNSVGKGSVDCQPNYITVLPAITMAGAQTVTTASGYLYDDGGPSSPYINNGGTPSVLIAPCADSVYLTFSMFDLNCNISFMQLYEGTNAKGRRLDPCGGTGLNSGFTGGPSGAACSVPCMPNVTKPDTFKAKTSMFIQMNDGSTSANAKGFAAYWWSKASSAKPAKASFTVAGSGDSICVNGQTNFTNTTTSPNANDVLTYYWDLDGDITTFECIGTCATAFWPYFVPGPTTVTLIAVNCGGSDTFQKTLTVYNPKTPKTAIKADNTNPTTADAVFFTAPIPQCVEDYKWTITKSAGFGTGNGTYINGTTNISAAPVVKFTDTSFYDVKLYVDNLSGAQKDSLTLKKYIHVRNPYCVPSVATLNQGMGISNVTFNGINNFTTQASQDYTNFTGVAGLSTTLAVGATYPISISRNSSLLYEYLNRSVYIDWNEDGLFTGKGEEAAEDSNSLSVTWTSKITVPKTAKLGATVMRVAVNRGAYSNKPGSV